VRRCGKPGSRLFHQLLELSADLSHDEGAAPPPQTPVSGLNALAQDEATGKRAMADDNFSGFGEAIRKAGEIFAEAVAAVSKTLENIASQAAMSDRERLLENWLRIARMSKDAIIIAIEQAYQYLEREVRRTAGAAASSSQSNPIDALVENWRKATEAFTSGNWNEEARKQADNIQKILAGGIRAWQRLWEPERK
jgi:hypothetical protein